jgi:hypothetical protein
MGTTTTTICRPRRTSTTIRIWKCSCAVLPQTAVSRIICSRKCSLPERPRGGTHFADAPQPPLLPLLAQSKNKRQQRGRSQQQKKMAQMPNPPPARATILTMLMPPSPTCKGACTHAGVCACANALLVYVFTCAQVL